MDNTEIHYLTYDPQAIYEEMVSTYMENGGDAISYGDEVDILFHGVLAIMTKAFAGVDNALRMGTLRYAVGAYLDVIGMNRGCNRIQASAATATAKFTFAQGAEGTLAKGTVITVDGKILWKTRSAITMTSGGQATVGIECTETGTYGNVLTSGETMQMVAPVAGVSTIVSASASTGGQDEEDDETYRERIRTYGDTSATTGTEEQYEAKAREINGVKDANAWATTITAAGQPNVNVSILVKSGFDSDTVVSAVQTAMNNSTFKPLTDTVSVSASAAVDYTLTATITMPASATSADVEEVKNAIDEYTEWQNNTVGLAYTPGKLLGMLYSAGALDVTLSATSRVDIGNANHCNVTVSYTIG